MNPSESTQRIDAHVWRIAFVVVIGSIMSILDTTIVNVALETLGHDLHTPLTGIQWVITGYMLALAAVIPLAGWGARRFGAKRLYLISLVLFTVGSALCGLATSVDELIVFRVIQGAGGGLILPLGQLMMASAAGPSRMGRVMSIVAIPAMLAPVLGPTLGGLILDNASWRWIFYVNLPVGALAFVASLRTLPSVGRAATDRLDARGLLLMVSGLPLLTYGLAEIGSTGSFSSPRVVLPIIAGVVLVTLFVLHALHVPRPLLDLRLYRRPTFAAASLAMFCLGGALFGGMILMPLYWQQVRLESVLDTGLLTAPLGLGMACVMPLAGRLSDRLGGGPPALFGLLLTTLATVPLAFIGANSSIAYLSAVMFVRGVGIGFAFMPTMAAAFASLERSELSDATPQMNVLQRVGGSMGTAVIAVVLQRALDHAHGPAAQAGAYGSAFWWSTGLTALAIIPGVVLIRAERAARARAAGRAAERAAAAPSLAEAVA